MDTITITGMELRRDDRVENGVRVLATFDYEDGTYVFKGCALIRMASSGSVRVSLPMIHRSRDTIRDLRFTNRCRMLDLQDTAERMFLQMGGDAALIGDAKAGSVAHG